MPRPSSPTPKSTTLLAAATRALPTKSRGERRIADRVSVSFRAFFEPCGERPLRPAHPMKSPALPQGPAEPNGGSAAGGGLEVDGERPRRSPLRFEGPSESLERFALPAPALLPPLGPSASTPPAVGSPLASAEAAALAERVLTSLRVGRVAGMPEVRMRLGDRGIEVRLRLNEGRVVPVLVAERPEEARAMAERLDALFAERDIEAEPVVVEQS